MEVFHRAADLIGLDRRVRMELEEPDYEHIFYVTVKLHTRLAPLTEGADKFRDLADSELLPDGLEPLLDGSFVFKRRALIGANVALRPTSAPTARSWASSCASTPTASASATGCAA